MSGLVVRNVAVFGRHQVPALSGAVSVQRRYESNKTNLGALKRGTGGRSSFSGIVATVFGASGFVGRYIINQLGKVGSQIIVPYRGDPYDVAPLKLAGDLGQVLFLPYQLKDEESVRQALQYSNVVINLIGREYETRNYSFHDVHVAGSRRIARLAKEEGVDRLIHFSALNASPNPQSIYLKGGSKFLLSKAKGEEAVREEFPEATIFRPSDIFGPEDRFLRSYAHFWRRNSRRSISLWKRGRETIKRPVFVSDVASGVLQAIQDRSTEGMTFEAVGPHSYYLCDLVDYFYRVMRYDDLRITTMTPLFMIKAYLTGLAPNYPLYNMDKIEMDHLTDKLQGLPNLEDLGVELTRIEDRARFELMPYRLYGYYAEELGEFAKAEPPEVVA